MYDYSEVLSIATRLAPRSMSMRYLERAVSQVVGRRRHRPFTARDAAMVAVEMVATSQRRLAHDTGAENWY